MPAAVDVLGAIGTHQGAIEPRIRARPAQRTHRVGVDTAGPGGDWRERERPQTGLVGWGPVPSVLPHKAGGRGTM
jgi:hypothetical protein